ncbi:hypothetical protein N9N67_10210 [Bacteriovoracaceae bacterium]|nr:hypothetical protein [Bacteriovoracaceae bacterium]
MQAIYCKLFVLTLLMQSFGFSQKEEEEPKYKKRQNYNVVRHTEKADFDEDNLLQKKFKINLPKSEIPFEILRITDLKKGVDRAKYLVLQKALRADRSKNGPRPEKLYSPYLTRIEITLKVKGNRGDDLIGLMAYYDDNFSSNPSYKRRIDGERFHYHIPSEDVLENISEDFGVEYYLIKFNGETFPVGSYKEGVDLLGKKPFEFYNIDSVVAGKSIPTKVESIRKNLIHGWQISEELGKVKISVPNPALLTGFSLYGKSKLSRDDEEHLSTQNVPYLPGTGITFSIENIEYSVMIPGLQGNPNKGWSHIQYDPNKEINFPHEVVEPSDGENYIAFEVLPATPLGFEYHDFAKEDKIKDLIEEIERKKIEIIEELEKEKQEIAKLEQEYDKTKVKLEKTESGTVTLSFDPDIENPLFEGTALVLDLSGSMRGESGELLKTAALEALHNLPEGKKFAIVFQKGFRGDVVFEGFDDTLSWKDNIIHMEAIINNMRFGGGASEILGAVLAVHDENKYPQSKDLSHIYVVTDGALGDYNEFNEGLSRLKGTKKEINVLQIGANFSLTKSDEVQVVAKQIKEQEKKIAILEISTEQLTEALNEAGPDDDAIELVNSKKETVTYTKDQAFLIIEQNKQTVEQIKIKLNALRNNYNEEMEGLLDETSSGDLARNDEGNSALLNSIADISGGSRKTVGKLDEDAMEKKERDIMHAQHMNTITGIEEELEERGLVDGFDENYALSLDQKVAQLKEELKDKKKPTQIFNGGNKKIRRQIRELKEMERELKRIKEEWEQDLLNSGFTRDEIKYLQRVHLNKYEWLKDIE